MPVRDCEARSSTTVCKCSLWRLLPPLSTGAPVAVRDREGDTPLHDAARNGHLAVVKALVAAWPVATPLDEPNHVGLSALELARRGGTERDRPAGEPLVR